MMGASYAKFVAVDQIIELWKKIPLNYSIDDEIFKVLAISMSDK